ncbi:MAG: fimbrillin family protein [Muribaculaceae bacterium]|nr:fimbrillin family protein [Muribaculaceae bacterium]
MNKSLLPLAMAVMTFTACTSEYVVDVSQTQSNIIGFDNVVNKSSRAVDGDLNNTSFDHFMVYGYYTKPNLTTPVQIFNGVDVNRKVVNGITSWGYDGVRYWVPGCSYFFYAYSCADIAISSVYGSPTFSLFDANNTSIDSRALLIQRYTCDQTHQHDLVYAENENILATEKGNPDVSLSFSHALCKIKAVFTTDFPDGYKVYVSNVYVSDFYNRADFNVGTGAWSNYTGEDNGSQQIILTVPTNSFVENKAGSKVATTEAFVIPKLYDSQGNTDNVRLHFSIKVESTKSGETILERDIVGTWSPQWEKSRIYTYNINITGSSTGIQPIVFSAVQDLSGSSSWDDSTSLNMVFGVDTKH